MKQHVVQDNNFKDANSLQSLFGINNMNVTISGNTKNNFFVAKDQIRQDAYKPNMQLKMMTTNQAKAHLSKVG